MLDQRPVGHRRFLDGLFEEAPKQQPPELRATPVEAKDELVEVGLEVVGGNGSLVGAQQPPFEETGDAVNSGQRHMGRLPGADNDMGLMLIAVPNRGRVRGQPISNNDGSRFYTVEEERA